MKFQARNNYVMNWPEYPLLRITLCFIIGIYLSDHLDIQLGISLLFSLGLWTTYILLDITFRKSRYTIRALSILVLLLGISFGLLRGNLQKVSNNPAHFENKMADWNLIEGKVVSELKKKNSISAIIEVIQINQRASSGKLLVYFNKGDSLTNYEMGDIIFLEGKIHMLVDNLNPKSFNYKEHLKYKGVNYQIFLKRDMHKRLSIGGLNVTYQLAYKIRKWAISIFEKRLRNKDQLATASAMVLGYKEHLSDELYTSFSETGAVHILAVSGLHVGIICMIFIFLFKGIKSDENVFKLVQLCTLLSAVWIYALVTGASPAVLRAAVMFSLILIGRLWFKGANIYNILAFSALLILLYDPFLLFQLSFQFSYLALISIVFFQPRIEELYDSSHWVITKVWQLISVSIAAQILIFPISIYHFHQFPTYFILSGVAAVFLATFILSFGLLLLVFDKIPILGDWFSKIYSILLECFLQIISFIQELPFNKVEGIHISISSMILLYVMIATMMFLISLKPKSYKDVFHKKMKRKYVAVGILACCIIFLTLNSILFTFRIKNQLQLIVYDVSKDTVIDIFCGNRLYTLHSEGIDESKLKFACQSYRIYNGNPKMISLNMDHDFQRDHLVISKYGSMVFKNRHLLFTDKIDVNSIIPCKSDVLFVGKKIDLVPSDFLKVHDPLLVVLDNSMSYQIKNQWTEECKKRNIDIHDIRKEGVFII